jgi:hypothetical protein
MRGQPRDRVAVRACRPPRNGCPRPLLRVAGVVADYEIPSYPRCITKAVGGALEVVAVVYPDLRVGGPERHHILLFWGGHPACRCTRDCRSPARRFG